MKRGNNMNDKGNYMPSTGLDHIVDNSIADVVRVKRKSNGGYGLILEDSKKEIVFDHLGKCVSFILYDELHDVRLTADQSFSEEETSVLKKTEYLQNLLMEMKTQGLYRYRLVLSYTLQQIAEMKDSRSIDECLDITAASVDSYLSDHAKSR